MIMTWQQMMEDLMEYEWQKIRFQIMLDNCKTS